MNKEDHIDNSLNKIRSIFEKTSARIEALKPKERVPATQLANELAIELGTEGGGAALYQVLKYLFKDYPGVKITRGAKGGIEKLENPLTPLTNIDHQQPDEQGLEVKEINLSELTVEDFSGYPNITNI